MLGLAVTCRWPFRPTVWIGKPDQAAILKSRRDEMDSVERALRTALRADLHEEAGLAYSVRHEAVTRLRRFEDEERRPGQTGHTDEAGLRQSLVTFEGLGARASAAVRRPIRELGI